MRYTSIRELLGWWFSEPASHPAIHWNPGNKVVQDHRDGTIDLDLTNRERAKRGLPVPWRHEFAEAETRMPDIL